MRSLTTRLMAWRGLPILATLLLLQPVVFFVACDDTGPSPIGDHAPDDVDSGSEEPEEDAAAEAATKDAEPEDDAGDGGTEEDTGTGEDAGKDAGDAGKDAGKDAAKDH